MVITMATDAVEDQIILFPMREQTDLILEFPLSEILNGVLDRHIRFFDRQIAMDQIAASGPQQFSSARSSNQESL